MSPSGGRRRQTAAEQRGHIELSDEQAEALAWTKSVHIGLMMATTLIIMVLGKTVGNLGSAGRGDVHLTTLAFFVGAWPKAQQGSEGQGDPQDYCGVGARSNCVAHSVSDGTHTVIPRTVWSASAVIYQLSSLHVCHTTPSHTPISLLSTPN
eukprot:COSAG01_NODE_4769_length_4754_cov_10.669388_2_plen_152_part_00